MGKRSDFERLTQDQYQTIDPRAVQRLLPFLIPGIRFAEPCAGKGYLIDQLEAHGLVCAYRNDITYPYGKDVTETTRQDLIPVDMIITNPPWDRKILHPMLDCFSCLGKPVWLLLDANWAFTQQASHYINSYCTDIATIGRLVWIPGTKMQGKDDAAWFRFSSDKNEQTRFWPRIEKVKI